MLGGQHHLGGNECACAGSEADAASIQNLQQTNGGVWKSQSAWSLGTGSDLKAVILWAYNRIVSILFHLLDGIIDELIDREKLGIEVCREVRHLESGKGRLLSMCPHERVSGGCEGWPGSS
jgi:hypothetical protein